MDPLKLQEALDEVFDQALLEHGFVNYTREYQLVIRPMVDPRNGTGIEPTTLRYLFRYCLQANCVTTVPAHVWRKSLDDRLTTYETGVNLDGYVWGVNWQDALPRGHARRRLTSRPGLGHGLPRVVLRPLCHRRARVRRRTGFVSPSPTARERVDD